MLVGDNKRMISDSSRMAVINVSSIPEIRPLVKTDPEAVTAMTRWLETHTKPAGNQSPSHTQNGKPRKRRVTV